MSRWGTKDGMLSSYLLASLIYAEAGKTIGIHCASKSSAVRYIRSLEPVVRSCKARVLVTFFNYRGANVTVDWWQLGFRK